MEQTPISQAPQAAKPTKTGTGCLGSFLIGGIIFVIVVILGITVWILYNRLVSGEQEVKEKWAQVENGYQRRLDLIKNLANTVERYAKHENTTLKEVQEARSKATAVTIKTDKVDETTMQKFQQEQDGLSSTLSRLMMVTENYPNLKADGLFIQLMADLKETEQIIFKARETFNVAAKEYNKRRQKFPTNIVGSMFGFPKEYNVWERNIQVFKPKEGSDQAPELYNDSSTPEKKP